WLLRQLSLLNEKRSGATGRARHRGEPFARRPKFGGPQLSRHPYLSESHPYSLFESDTHSVAHGVAYRLSYVHSVTITGRLQRLPRAANLHGKPRSLGNKPQRDG